MKLFNLFIMTLVIIIPYSVFSEIRCDGNTYEINQCLKSQMTKFDYKINKLKNHDSLNFKKYRDNICNDISSTYKGGSYQAIKYGNCIVSLDKWYIKQTKR